VAGAEWLHVVDLEGARDGNTPNIETVSALARESGLKVEIGGGIRSVETAKKYIDAGVERVILGTAAVTDPQMLEDCLRECEGRVVVGVDLRGEAVAIKGWLEEAPMKRDDFFRSMVEKGVRDFIVTDISRDGAMKGTNTELYKSLSEKFPIDIIASGGVTDMTDIVRLRDMGMYGAILGKAFYTGAIDLKTAITEAKR
jgi:phosphoribosylformimino-5-aminoimidazole carboxamide ribotide isomerase